MSSFKRRNTDWQAYGQHRRRAWVRQALRNQAAKEKAEAYQARFSRPNKPELKK